MNVTRWKCRKELFGAVSHVVFLSGCLRVWKAHETRQHKVDQSRHACAYPAQHLGGDAAHIFSTPWGPQQRYSRVTKLISMEDTVSQHPQQGLRCMWLTRRSIRERTQEW